MRPGIDWSNVYIIHNAQFDRNCDMHPDAMRRIVSTVRSLLSKRDATSLAVWFYPEETFNDSWSDVPNKLTIGS
ncbi:Ff.00g072270.m01.CDS01 [Fusarium sp. VM40]|nr:Ff.00g072270.m01.CDS01 [Fusarium sp. VM40]